MWHQARYRTSMRDNPCMNNRHNFNNGMFAFFAFSAQFIDSVSLTISNQLKTPILLILNKTFPSSPKPNPTAPLPSVSTIVVGSSFGTKSTEHRHHQLSSCPELKSVNASASSTETDHGLLVCLIVRKEERKKKKNLSRYLV